MIELRVGPARVAFTMRVDGDLGRTDPGVRAAAPGVRAADSGSQAADPRVAAARERVRRALGLEGIAGGWQVHRAGVATVDAARPGYVVAAEAADGQATHLHGLGVAVHAADCLPVAVAGSGGVAMLHAGWRGLAAGVIAEGVAALRRLGVVGPLEAAIGPGAGGCCYEVGDEVRAAFAGVPGAAVGRRVDLKAVARFELDRSGVERISDVGLCSICSPSCFSNRRDGPATGRQAGIAWLR
jgi:YfiH family protein